MISLPEPNVSLPHPYRSFDARSQVGDVVCEIELEHFHVGVKVETPGFLAEICKSRWVNDILR